MKAIQIGPVTGRGKSKKAAIEDLHSKLSTVLSRNFCPRITKFGVMRHMLWYDPERGFCEKWIVDENGNEHYNTYACTWGPERPEKEILSQAALQAAKCQWTINSTIPEWLPKTEHDAFSSWARFQCRHHEAVTAGLSRDTAYKYASGRCDTLNEFLKGQEL